MFIANGFEEIEALCPLDLLRRADLEVKTVGIGGKEICGSHGITVLTDIEDKEYSDPSPDMIILPGGMPGTTNLEASCTVNEAISTAVKNNTYIAAICAAPMILGKKGLLNGKTAVCFPGFEEYLQGAKEQFVSKYMQPIVKGFAKYFELLAGRTDRDWMIDANLNLRLRVHKSYMIALSKNF